MSGLNQAIKRGRAAIRGDSNDEEHDALVELLEAITHTAEEFTARELRERIARQVGCPFCGSLGFHYESCSEYGVKGGEGK